MKSDLNPFYQSEANIGSNPSGYSLGRKVGHATMAVMGALETVTGGTMMGGGALLSATGLRNSCWGTGFVGGTLVAAHGIAVSATAVNGLVTGSRTNNVTGGNSKKN